MKTLYLSDLDGTLLQSSIRISEYSLRTINALIEKGLLFSYATARSIVTAEKVTKGLNLRLPPIINNGAFILDEAKKPLIENFLGDSAQAMLESMFEVDVFPLVYAFIDGRERFSYCPSLCTEGMNAFLDMRKGDIRIRTVDKTDELKRGRIFNIICIDEPDKLHPLYEEFRESYSCVYHKDIYTHYQWLDISSKAATKANAAKQLQKLLGCDRIVAFGDGKNDIELFKAADECYATANADDELKKLATDIILSNDEDGVAKWLERNAAETAF